jgi:hypothetical protein
MDADSWTEREKRFTRKFEAGRKHIPGLFKGMNAPDEIKQLAVFGSPSIKNQTKIGGGEIVLLSQLLNDILEDLKSEPLFSQAVPEQFTILRTFQVVANFPKVVTEALLVQSPRPRGNPVPSALPGDSK